MGSTPRRTGWKALASDKIQVTVFQDAVGQGKTALAVALKLIKGEKVESHVWIPFELVTKENMQTYVERVINGKAHVNELC